MLLWLYLPLHCRDISVNILTSKISFKVKISCNISEISVLQKKKKEKSLWWRYVL